MKKTIVHVIDSFGRGGAETMLVALLPELSKAYDVILVTLNSDDDFENDRVNVYKRYCLHCNSRFAMPAAVLKLKKIIRRHAPALVRTQLFWSTIIGRLATPATIPFIFSVHSKLSLDAFKAGPIAYWLEKRTYKKRHTLLAVSRAVLADYAAHIGIRGEAFVLNNFVQPVFFQQEYRFELTNDRPVRIVAVGNLKAAKNYQFLLNVVASIKQEGKIEIDIIGEGPLREELQHFINFHNLPVTLLGKKANVEQLLPGYDAFIMCSLHEGFGNAPVEAMATGLPLLLNNSDTMKEMSKGNALFYKSGDEHSLKDLLLHLKDRKAEMAGLSKKGKAIAESNYTRSIYFSHLQQIYEQHLAARNVSGTE
jgi:glycosyltransferase involved in cell wall biosynthesis